MSSTAGIFCFLLGTSLAAPVGAAETPKVEEIVTVPPDKIEMGDFVADVGEVGEAMAYLRSCKKGVCPPLEGQESQDSIPLTVAYAMLLAAIFKMLLSGVKLSSPFWKGKKGKVALRLSTVLLGAGVFLTSTVAGGATFAEALILALSGPGAIAVHELLALIPGFKKEESVG